jgi:hypothetical protein
MSLWAKVDDLIVARVMAAHKEGAADRTFNC